MKIVKLVSHLIDPWRPFSIGNIAASPEGCNFHFKIDAGLLMSNHELDLISRKEFSKLPKLIHNLSASADLQRDSLRKGVLLLNCWELLTIFLCKCLSKQ